MASYKSEVQDLVQAMNLAWREERIDDLNSYFDEVVVMVPPGGGESIIGREAMVNSYRDYVKKARTLSFTDVSLKTDIVGATAVVRHHFNVRYEIGGTQYDEEGIDLLVLNRDSDSWRIIWRTQIPADASNA